MRNSLGQNDANLTKMTCAVHDGAWDDEGGTCAIRALCYGELSIILMGNWP